MATAPAPERRLVNQTGASGGRTLNGSGSSAGADDAPAEKKSKKKLFIIIGVVVIVAGAAAYMFLMPSPPPGPPTEGKIIALDSQTLNLTDGHYLKLTVAVGIDSGAEGNFDQNKADEQVIEEFSNRSIADISTNAQRDALKKELIANLKKIFKDTIYDVYITQFVTQ